MSNLSNSQQRIEQLVSQFTSDLVAIAGELATETLVNALGGASPKTNGHAGNGHNLGRGTGNKRDPKELAAIGDRFAAFVKAHPGLRIEQINKQIGTTTSALSLPIRKLVAAGTIKVKGAKRSTTYFAGAPAPSEVKSAKPPSKKKRFLARRKRSH